MGSLSDTWFIEGNIDFEHKKYTLLAYLQRINKAFDAKELYPSLADVIQHFRNLNTFKENKKLLQQQFPKKVTGVQIEKIRLIYEEMIADDEIMEQIEEIVYYAMQTMKDTVSTGTEFYDFVENSFSITPVGILPSTNEEGYFFLCDGKADTIRVYDYQLTIYSKPNDRFRTLRSNFINDWTRNFINTYESIKLELLNTYKTNYLPAVYSIETNLSFPIEATLLPVAKRSFVRYLSA